MIRFKESELVLNPDGSIYHLRMRPEHVAGDVIVVGDPARVKEVSKYFDAIEHQAVNREMVSHTGSLNNKRITVISTGMGPDNIDIVMNELDALVNIDLEKRVLKKDAKHLNIIRLGTCGALQPDIPVDSFVVSTHGLGMDGLLYYYKDSEKIMDHDMTRAFIAHSNWPSFLATPYVVEGSSGLMSSLGDSFIHGVTATAPGFYGPQGRELRMRVAYPDLMKSLEEFAYQGNRVTNLEMETATLYGMGKMLGHEMLTICLVLANRPNGDYSKNYKNKMDELIRILLERLAQ